MLLPQGHECAAGLVVTRAKAFACAPTGGNGGSILGASFPCWGHHHRPPCHKARGSPGVNYFQLWTSVGNAIGVTSSLEAPLLETGLGLW